MKKVPFGEGSQLSRFYWLCWLGQTSARFRTCLGRAYRLKAPSLAFSFGFVLLF
jgi:hypothetical protein